MGEDFKKSFIEYAQKCWNQHQPFAWEDCLNDLNNGKFVSLEDYNDLKNFRWIDGILRFKFKTAYEFRDTPEAIARQKAEFEEGERLRQVERNRQYNEELRVRQLAGQIMREEAEKKAREIIAKEKEETELLKQKALAEKQNQESQLNVSSTSSTEGKSVDPI